MKKISKVCTVLWMICCITSTNAQSPAFKVEVAGKGAPVLLLPGFACTGAIWDYTVKELSKSYECHVFTFAGFGGVSPIQLPWLSTIKDELIRYVKIKKLNKPSIIGHSLGGTLALWLAAEEQDLFAKVLAVDALPCTGALMVPNFDPANMQYDNPYSKQMLNMDSTEFRKMAAQQAAFMMLNKTKQDTIINWMIQADRNTFVYGYVDLLKLDLREKIADIKIPVVIFAATFPDKKAIEKTYNTQFEKLNNKTIFYADAAAHFIMLDQPEWLMNKIKENL